MEPLIQNLNPFYSFLDERWPTILCSNCKNAVVESENGVFRQNIGNFNFEQVINKRLPSARKSVRCTCVVCKLFYSLSVCSSKNLLQRNKKIKNKVAGNKPLCSSCLKQSTLKHKCSKLNLINRTIEIVKKQNVEQVVASTILKDITNDENPGTKQILLKNLRGKPSTVCVGITKKNPEVSVKDIVQLQKRCGSLRNTKRVVTDLRRIG